MNINDENKFYKNDKKIYELSNNKDFLEWLKVAINNGYKPIYTINELQKLIEKISNWYELKFVDRELSKEEGIIDSEFLDVEDISTYMSTIQLLYRLNNKENNFLKCKYRTGSGYSYPIIENGKTIWRDNLFLKIYDKNNRNDSYLFIYADNETGKIRNNSSILEYINKDDITLEELYDLLKNNDNLKIEDLYSCIYNHKCDLELRKYILECVAYKLIYSKKTIPIRGYKRAINFIDEFNYYFNLDINTDNIDNLINNKGVYYK